MTSCIYFDAAGRKLAANFLEANYYAYGLPTSESYISANDSYGYGGKEFYSLKGINLYDFAARTYAPDLARFMQPDPLADDYHWLSPYILCGGDPINFVDPDGMVRYYVGMDGRIIPREDAIKLQYIGEYAEELTDNDQIVILGKDGTVIDVSEKYEEGTIQRHNNSKSELKNTDVTLFEINNKTDAKNIFEFMAKNITLKNRIEFGLIIMDGGSSNDVFTGHTPSKLEGFNNVFIMRVDQGHIFDEIDHSHKMSAEPSRADYDSAKGVLRKIIKAKKQKVAPVMNVFDSWGGHYYRYYPKKKRTK